MVAGETDETVAEVFTLEQDEEGEDDGEECSGKRFDNAAQLIETAGGAADFANLEGMLWTGADGFLSGLVWRLEGGGGGVVDDAELVADLLEFALGASEGGVAGAMKSVELGGNVVAVNGEVVGDGDELSEDRPSSDKEQGSKGDDDGESSEWARKTEALKESHNGGQEERKEDGYAEREKENFGQIKDRNGKNDDGEQPELGQEACGGRTVHVSSEMRRIGSGARDWVRDLELVRI